VLQKLGFSDRPDPALPGLQAIYAAWCQRVPFDNVQKLIHMRTRAAGPLPGDDAVAFFGDWLKHGTGGTCWAGNGGLYALLVSVGFSATRGIATMLSSPTIPPNHGTVVIELDASRYLVDASMLHGQPLHLDDRATTSIDHPAWGVECRLQDGRWHIRWRPLHTPSGIDCRVEHLGATREAFSEKHEETRPWSPFNYELAVRLVQGDTVEGAAFGQRVTIDRAGAVRAEPMDEEARTQLLIGRVGMSEEIVHRLPPDMPTPPFPGRVAQVSFG
jgi:N-hydroxyarylamine O-acetyltransferase